MENQINYLSNETADKLVADSHNKYNSLSLKIPFSYVKKNILLNWYDILFLINNEYIDKSSAIEYAIDNISISSNDRIMYLACANEFDIYDDLYLKTISDLADILPEETKRESNNKILYLVLSWLYSNRLSLEDPIHILDIVFDDFEFPPLLQSTIDYLHTLDKTSKYKEQACYMWQELLNELKKHTGYSINIH